MPDKRTINALREYLAREGFVAAILPRASHDTPDLLVKDEHETYVVEVKQRYHPPQPWTGLVRRNTISGVVEKAARQLAAFEDDDPLRVMWFIAQPPEQKWYYDSLRMSVYGLSVVTGLGENGGVAKACYYATENDFWRWREILDGVILGTVAAVFINDLSPRADRLKASRLCRFSQAPVCDPREEERTGLALSVRGEDIDRADKQAVRSHLEKKYGLANVNLEVLMRFTA
jgi:hypothetical protein